MIRKTVQKTFENDSKNDAKYSENNIKIQGQNDADFFAQSRGNCSKIIRSRIVHNDAALGLIITRYGDTNC